jgi:hypothetical protein
MAVGYLETNCQWRTTGGSAKRMGKLSSALRHDEGHSGVGNSFPNCHGLGRWRCNFKGLSQNGERVDFSKNLRASLFNKGLSNVPNFGAIHLAGQND